MELFLSLKGSPPHTRGKESEGRNRTQSIRITPAYAGKRKKELQKLAAEKDHPRIRGEKMLRLLTKIFNQGSPPHTRGKDPSKYPRLSMRGITPAYAGKSFTKQTRKQAHWDHPRIRGEKSYQYEKHRKYKGSPPHTRGKVNISVSIDTLSRITPAYAGKS